MKHKISAPIAAAVAVALAAFAPITAMACHDDGNDQHDRGRHRIHSSNQVTTPQSGLTTGSLNQPPGTTGKPHKRWDHTAKGDHQKP